MTVRERPRRSILPATRLAAVWPAARGKAPTRAKPVSLAPELAVDLLPPLSPAARDRLVDVLADVALGALDLSPSTPIGDNRNGPKPKCPRRKRG
jgi:hypothetical protein